MEELLTKILGNIPATASIVISLVAIGLTWFLNLKKVNIQETQTVQQASQQQVQLLMEQIELLSKQLQQAREQLLGLHNQNITLMGQIRSSQQRIIDLERALAERRQLLNLDDSNNPKS